MFLLAQLQMQANLSDRFNDTRDRSDEAFELRDLDGQYSTARCGQLVVASAAAAAAASRRAPLRGHPTANSRFMR
jgi:hypothetical protein